MNTTSVPYTFAQVRRLSDYYRPQQVLQPRGFVKRLIEEGYLRTPTPSEGEGELTTVELKSIAESLGLRTSGTKAELFGRILERDSQSVSLFFQRKGLYVHSEKGCDLIEDMRVRAVTAKKEARAQVLRALVMGQSDSACRAYLHYLREWEPSTTAELDDDVVAEVKYTVAAKPASLAGLENQRFLRLRGIAAMRLLWQTEDQDSDYDDDEDETGPTVKDVGDYDEEALGEDDIRAIGHIRRNAEYHSELDKLLDDVDEPVVVTFRFPKVSINSCSSCRSVHGKLFARDQLPEFPLVDCPNERGCKFEMEYDTIEEEEAEEEQERFFDPSIPRNVTPTISTRLSRLKDLFDDELITKEEYERKKAQILDEL